MVHHSVIFSVHGWDTASTFRSSLNIDIDDLSTVAKDIVMKCTMFIVDAWIACMP